MSDEMFSQDVITSSQMPKFRKNACAESPQTWKVLSVRRVD